MGEGAEPLPPVILLAAGEGTRVGSPKGLVRVRGRPWLELQLDALAASGLARAVLVLGHAWDEYVRAFPWIGAVAASSVAACGIAVDVVRNAAPERGPFSSIQAGTSRAGRAGAFVLPIDVPCPDREVWSRLARALPPSAAALAAVPSFAGRSGHPVLCSVRFVDRLRAVALDAPDARLDLQLRALGAEALRVAVDDAKVTMNLNTKDDWDRLG